jgi:hypothetical protein
VRVTVTFMGLPVVTAAVGVVGSVIVGQGPALTGYGALRRARPGSAELEMRDALGASVPADVVRVYPIPWRRRLIVLARIGRRTAGVPAWRLPPRGADADSAPQ